jgi:hypothetical protein
MASGILTFTTLHSTSHGLQHETDICYLLIMWKDPRNCSSPGACANPVDATVLCLGVSKRFEIALLCCPLIRIQCRQLRQWQGPWQRAFRLTGTCVEQLNGGQERWCALPDHVPHRAVRISRGLQWRRLQKQGGACD